MKLITSPSPIDTAIGSVTPSIFLAGSIEQDTAVDWQSAFVTAMSDIECTLFNPRRAEWDATWTEDNPKFQEQVSWELNALDQADLIIMRFEPETKSPITLLELGLYASSGKLLVSCPPGFWRRGNVKIVCGRYGVPMYDEMSDLTVAVKARLESKRMLRLIKAHR